MPDEIDLASEQSERWLAQALANQAANGSARLTPKGSCHYCETDFDKKDPDFEKKLFCDKDCAADHEEEQRLKNRR